MFASFRETLASVQTELSAGIEKIMPSPSSLMPQNNQKSINAAIDEIVNTSAGSELLLKYQSTLQEMRQASEESARLANLCSTRMGRSQQMCKERADAVLEIDNFLRNTSEVDKLIRDINKQIDKLGRFCIQTEQALTHLEGLDKIVRTEEEVELVRQQVKIASTIVQIEPVSSASLITNISRPGDSAREKQEEVILEEFLSSENK